MKKQIFNTIILFTTLLISMIGCKDPATKPQTEPTAETKDFNLYQAEWFGNYYKTNTSNFYLQFTETDINLEDLAEGEGWLWVMDVHCAQDLTTLTEGTYNCSKSAEVGTFTAGVLEDDNMKGSFIRYIIGGYFETAPIAIDNGTLTITKEGNAYNIIYKGTVDGKEREFHFKGQMPMENNAYPREPMNPITKEITATTGAAKFYGRSETSNVGEFIVTLSGEYNLSLGLYSTATATAAEIPTGTYSTENAEGEQFSLIKGYSYLNNQYPTIVFTQSQNAFYFIRRGTVTIAKSSDNYNIEFTGTSACGSQFTFHFNAPITIKDMTGN